MKPVIAIVGRPNVGKSTLFNRIVGRRTAITLDEPGVTRDRRYAEAAWDGRDFRVVDTGGFFLDDHLEEKVRQQIETALCEALVVLFVMDGRQGLTPEDENIAGHLRRFSKKTFFVVNKIDTTRQEGLLADFYRLGEDLHPVSAEDGLRVNDLLDEVVKNIPTLTLPSDKGREWGRIRVAIVGRPNVGKSSLLNRLLGVERVVVDPEPGTTRDSIDTPIRVGSREYLLIDTAGMRRRAKSASKVERYSVLNALKSVERADLCLFLLDAAAGIHNQDAHLAGLIQKAGKGVVLIWNKWDLIRHSRKESDDFSRLVRERLAFLDHAPLLFVSAKNGLGCPSLWPTIDSLHEACGRRIATREANCVLEQLTRSHNPPVFKGRPVTFKYLVQTGVFPPAFTVFTNEPAGVHFSFRRYLVNSLRNLLQFDGAPIEIRFRRK